ncbi:hypothetical protein NLU13_6294 [Sarocladium strictum]|uniref:Uncharacterized protein n=1 Tax=Sarocladium strictum TaxID=5046 RepID=A0AA39GGX3_SARSR|nr:hypothetical protein NLU13_6294 [Sarocladium strictum]
MAAISTLEVTNSVLSQLAKREKSWPQREVGVMVVLCIVFVVAVGLIGLWLYKLAQKRKAAKATF